MTVTGLRFPCRFEIKAMGRRQPRFESLVESIVAAHLDGGEVLGMQQRASRHGKYLSVTCTIEARDREQLDRIYRDLSAHPEVLAAL
ncbi:MAG: DUF493 domain-containing protein [Gammaproteobacteria bacterium]|jgi:hypothetical protein|nr:DUF493 domain-containing protein [Gammaproteobacteria bacterium]